MNDVRIQIKLKSKEVISGRWEERYPDYYTCWATPMELYGKELYEAINIKYENVLVFKVRYCNKIKDMRKTQKNHFIIILDGVEYTVYQIDFKANAKDYAYIKARMVI